MKHDEVATAGRTNSTSFCRGLGTAALLGLGMWAMPLVHAGIGSISPIDSLTATGDAGLITSINGIQPSELLLGVTTFPNPPKHAEYPASNADNFDLNLVGSADEQPFFEVRFDQPVMTVFVIENGGNDCGLMQALDASGQPVGAQVYCCSHAELPTYYLTGYGQIASGLIVRMDAPAYGIQLTPLPGTVMGFDPVSVSASPRPSLQWRRDPSTGDQQVLWHSSNWLLQQKTGFDAGWSDVPNASSPFTVAPDGIHRFFRLRSAE
jgi:hypothetical protein